MLRLGKGRHGRLVHAALTEQTSVIGVDIAADKMLAKRLLADAGIPVPEGVVAWSAGEAVAGFEQLGGPVVIKPRNGSHGVSVIIGVTTAAEAAAAYAQATAQDGNGGGGGGGGRGGDGGGGGPGAPHPGGVAGGPGGGAAGPRAAAGGRGRR